MRSRRNSGDGPGAVTGAGQLPLRMSSVGVSPPVAFMGMFKTHHEVSIHFSLVTVIVPETVTMLWKSTGL